MIHGSQRLVVTHWSLLRERSAALSYERRKERHEVWLVRVSNAPSNFPSILGSPRFPVVPFSFFFSSFVFPLSSCLPCRLGGVCDFLPRPPSGFLHIMESLMKCLFPFRTPRPSCCRRHSRIPLFLSQEHVEAKKKTN